MGAVRFRAALADHWRSVLTAIAFQALAAVGGMIEILVTVAGLAVFGLFVFDDFLGRVDLFPAAIAGVGFNVGSGSGPGRLGAFSHVGLPDGGRAIDYRFSVSAVNCGRRKS